MEGVEGEGRRNCGRERERHGGGGIRKDWRRRWLCLSLGRPFVGSL